MAPAPPEPVHLHSDRCRRTAGELRGSLADLLDELRPDALTASDACDLVERLAQLESLAHAGLCLVAGRAAGSDAWRAGGDKRPADWLARVTGLSKAHAHAVLRSAERLASQPAVSAAARAGHLSPDKLHDVVAAVAADPGAADELVDGAAAESVAELRERCRRTKAAAMSDDEKARRVRRKRRVTHAASWDGSARITYVDTSANVAEVLAVLEHFRDQIFQQARKSGARDDFGNYAADAMVAMARASMSTTAAAPGKRPAGATKIIVRVDYDALVRGHTEPGETCEIAGLGPIPVAAVLAMLDDAFLSTIVTHGIDVLNVSHRGRKPTAHQRTALEWAHTSCTVLGCPNRAFLEIDHRMPWSEVLRTELGNLDPLCSHHHHLKGHNGFRLEPGRGRRRMLPPTRGRPRPGDVDDRPPVDGPPHDPVTPLGNDRERRFSKRHPDERHPDERLPDGQSTAA